MLGPGPYLLGAAELTLLIGTAWLGGSAVRARLLPRFEGAPAHLATSILSLALLIWSAELLAASGFSSRCRTCCRLRLRDSPCALDFEDLPHRQDPPAEALVPRP